MQLVTKRLLLRRMTLLDASFVLEILNDPDFVRFVGNRGIRTLAAAEQYFRERIAASYERHGYGLYAVESRGTSVSQLGNRCVESQLPSERELSTRQPECAGALTVGPIGMCGLVKRDYLGDADIGFAFLPRFRGCGLAAEAIAAVVRHAREDCGLERLAAIVNADNIVSIRLLERAGMRFKRTVQPPEGGPAVLCYGIELAVAARP